MGQGHADECGIEFVTRPLAQSRRKLPRGRLGHREQVIDGMGDREDAGRLDDLLVGQPIGPAGAVPALDLGAHRLGDGGTCRQQEHALPSLGKVHGIDRCAGSTHVVQVSRELDS